VFDAPDSSVTNRANSGLLIPRPGTEWKVMICPRRERSGEERDSGGPDVHSNDGGRTRSPSSVAILHHIRASRRESR